MTTTKLSGKITPNFTWEEATTTNTGISNQPDSIEDIQAIRLTADRMEAVRDYLGSPWLVTSWYRNARVNSTVGGKKNSQHLIGEAVDGAPTKLTQAEAIHKLLRPGVMRKLKIDQLIWEPNWIHISFITHPSKRGRSPRHQYLDLRGNR